MPKDIQRAVHFYQRAAAQGNAKAQCNLGVIFLRGDSGIPPDQAKAVELFKMAADQGQAVCMSNLGICLWNGFGVDQNHRLAAE